MRDAIEISRPGTQLNRVQIVETWPRIIHRQVQEKKNVFADKDRQWPSANRTSFASIRYSNMIPPLINSWEIESEISPTIGRNTSRWEMKQLMLSLQLLLMMITNRYRQLLRDWFIGRFMIWIDNAKSTLPVVWSIDETCRASLDEFRNQIDFNSDFWVIDGN